jgi:hypothetical protein
MIQAGLAEADVGSAYPNAKLYGGHGAVVENNGEQVSRAGFDGC